MSSYSRLGVDPKKRETLLFRRVIDSVFPSSFAPILTHPKRATTGVILHVDGAGSKPIQAYLNWKETGDDRFLEGIAQDVVAMNVDDILAVGALPIAFADYIALNSFSINRRNLISSLCKGFDKCLAGLRKKSIPLRFAGGETADLPDQVETFDVAGAILGEIELKKVVRGDSISSGDVILGLASGGRVKYEKAANSGIMCNGITLARHCLMSRDYNRKYPETYRSSRTKYYGRYHVEDYESNVQMTVGEALMSPIRIFAPIVKKILEDCHHGIKALIHNTGGGLTKCLGLGRSVHYIKNSLPEPDPIFRLIKKESKTTWKEMYVDFNMGIGYEVVLSPEYVEQAMRIAESYDLGCWIIGSCKKNKGPNQLTIKNEYGKFHYDSLAGF